MGQSGVVIQLQNQKQILFHEIAKIEKTEVHPGKSLAVFPLVVLVFIALVSENEITLF